jgi:hypothetical protein
LTPCGRNMYGRPVKTPGNCHVPWKPWAWHPCAAGGRCVGRTMEGSGAMPTALRGHAGPTPLPEQPLLIGAMPTALRGHGGTRPGQQQHLRTSGLTHSPLLAPTSPRSSGACFSGGSKLINVTPRPPSSRRRTCAFLRCSTAYIPWVFLRRSSMAGMRCLRSSAVSALTDSSTGTLTSLPARMSFVTI